jgi:hypothetical protein
MRRPALLAVLAFGASVAGTARAQDTGQPPAAESGSTAAPPAEKGPGQRGSFLLSIENVFGYLHQSFSEGGTDLTFDNTGFFPATLGTRLGLHGVTDSGITYGGIVGVTHVSNTGSGTGGSTLLELGPRIGYAFMLPKAPTIGLWGRVGPTFTYADSFDNGGSDNAWFLDLSFDAFIVWTPVEHFGLLAGPTLDVALTGNDSPPQGQSAKITYGTFGMGFGLVFDF